MPDPYVLYERQNAVGVITLNRPSANSYDRTFIEHLGAALDAVTGDAAAKAVVVRSASEKFFSAGADVKFFAEGTPESNRAMVRLANETLDRIATMPQVFIAAINGHALGGGLEIALACDLRFAAEGSYKLGLPEVTLGLLPGTGGTQRLPRLIGRARALEMMITGRSVGPQEALELGFVNRLIPAESLMSEAMAFANGLAAGATFAIGQIKLAVHEGVDEPLAAGLAIERHRLSALVESHDGR
ncbi:MAG: enoyl-CoA hydratase/isomerase family protein, partial [Chloroflexi bacterium]|nr:enoyl-CoA hydratase/isomerase family protein [Chloroflexota bacterium]